MTAEIHHLYRHMPHEFVWANNADAVALHIPNMRLTHASLPELKPQWAINREVAAGRAGSIRAAILILGVVAGLWGGIKLEQWATAHIAALVEAGG